MQIALTSISNWGIDNLMEFSQTKSAAVFFTRFAKTVPTPPKLMFGSFRLKWVDTYKYFGLTFDRRLNWKANIESLSQSLLKKSAILHRTIIPRKSPPPYTMLQFVRSVLYGTLSYGIEFWSHFITQKQIDSLMDSIIRVLRRTLQLPFDASSHTLFVEFGLPSFEQRCVGQCFNCLVKLWVTFVVVFRLRLNVAMLG